MKSIQPIEPYVKENFRTLCDAIAADCICLMSVYDALLGKPATNSFLRSLLSVISSSAGTVD